MGYYFHREKSRVWNRENTDFTLRSGEDWILFRNCYLVAACAKPWALKLRVDGLTLKYKVAYVVAHVTICYDTSQADVRDCYLFLCMFSIKNQAIILYAFFSLHT